MVLNVPLHRTHRLRLSMYAKFMARRDRALATIVLSVEPSLLYLIGDPVADPVAVWQKLADQFQKKTCVTD